MRIITAVFNYPGNNVYERCLNAMTKSIHETNPDADFRILRIPPPAPVEGAFQGWVNNHVKLRAYANQPLDQNTVFVDADTVFLRDISELFEHEFDIAIARRPHTEKAIYNGGVVLFKPSQPAREFMSNWITVDKHMLYDQEFHEKWHKKYRGQNQSSMGYLLENNPRRICVKEFTTAVLNACEQDWANIDKQVPYILHVRKRLLELAQSGIGIDHVSPRYRKAIKIWRGYEEKA